MEINETDHMTHTENRGSHGLCFQFCYSQDFKYTGNQGVSIDLITVKEGNTSIIID